MDVGKFKYYWKLMGAKRLGVIGEAGRTLNHNGGW